MANGKQFKTIKEESLYINYATNETRCFKKKLLASYNKQGEFRLIRIGIEKCC